MIHLRWINKYKKYLFLQLANPTRTVIQNYCGCSNSFETSASQHDQQCFNDKTMWSVLFFGTDNFSLESLRQLHSLWSKNLLSNLEVVTSYNPAKENNIALFAREHNIKINSWPITFPISGFHIGIVVSFGHLIPTWIIQSFPLGMINVHASLLPRWRGAAPIIHSLMHGDTTTGISIIKIMPNKFDVGDILAQTKIAVHPDEIQPQLYNKMAYIGAELLIKTVQQLPNIINAGIPQSGDNVTYAPKITKALSLIHWDKMTAADVYNLQRALTGLYSLSTYFHGEKLKLFDIQRCDKQYFNSPYIVPGLVMYDKKNSFIAVQCRDGRWVSVKQISMNQRRKMTANDFNNGFMNHFREEQIIFTSKLNKN